jgi:hypothetical protein
MESENGNGISTDELIRAASNSIGENMAPLFHFWGRQASSDLVDELKDLPLSVKVYNHLIDYKKLIPSNTSEFQQWYDANYLSVGGVQQVRYDYAINNFDADNYGSDIQAQIDLIIETYYGEGYVSVENEGVAIKFSLDENYPNPFNPSTTLRFDLPNVSNATLTIFNMLGQKVKTFNLQNRQAGSHSLKWNATNDYGDPVSAGIYLYQLQTRDFVKTRKMVLLK